MFSFVRKSKLEQLLREQLAERERLVQVLVEQIEYLRTQLYAPTNTVTRAAAPLPDIQLPEPIQMTAMNALSDEEEEIEAMRQAGVITEPEYQEHLARLKTRAAGDIIE